MTTAVASAPILPQLEGANLLNLMIVDDERAIREACREVAQSLGFNTCVADSAEHSYRSGHCGDRLWNGAIGGAGHEEWRLRLCHQAFQYGRAEAAVAARLRALEAENRKSTAAGEDQIQTRFRQHRRPGARDGETLSDHRQGGAQQPPGSDPGRKRNR
jgi:hypothetical protein